MKKFGKKKWLMIPVILMVVLMIFFVLYVRDYYHSDECVEFYLRGTEEVEVSEIEEGYYLDGPGTECAMVFYPGAKVEYTAYLPLLFQVAEQGMDCFLVKMPCNLAFLGQNKADTILEEYEYSRWYLSGHSLGGAMAASYISKCPEAWDGLVLLAAYPTKDLSGDSLSVLSIYGSEDEILNQKMLEKGWDLMPSDYMEICIKGGNHAGFGNYEEQKGDGEALISRKEQQEMTAASIIRMIEQDEETRQEEMSMNYLQITAQEAKEIIDKENDIVILDVRTPEEYATGHIKGAINIPNEEIIEEAPEALSDKNQEILIYCRSGNRSKQAAQKLADMGYENVIEFGGIMDWPYPELVE